MAERVAAERRAAGREGLVVDADLVEVARRHSAAMASEGRLYHNPRLAEQVQEWVAVGENVGRGATVDDVHTALMASAQHRGEILDARFTGIGVGVVESGGVLWVTEVFRQRAAAATSAAAPAPAPPRVTPPPPEPAEPEPAEPAPAPTPPPAVPTTEAPTTTTTTAAAPAPSTAPPVVLQPAAVPPEVTLQPVVVASTVLPQAALPAAGVLAALLLWSVVLGLLRTTVRLGPVTG